MRIALPSRRAALAGAMLLALVAATLTTPAEAQWRWRDAKGQVNASDRPPPKDIPEKDIRTRPTTVAMRRQAAPAADAASGAASAPPVAAAASGASGLQAEVESRKRRAEQEQTARAKADEERLAAQRGENCRRARAHAASFESGQRLARTIVRGEREVLDDKGRADELRAARAVIANDCR